MKKSHITSGIITVLIHIFLVSVFLSCSNIETSKADKIFSLVNSGSDDLVIVDLRDVSEYNKGHIKGAVNIPYKEENFPERISAIENKDKTAVFYCGQGVKTGKASGFIKKSSFKKKYILEGGFLSWKNRDLEIVK